MEDWFDRPTVEKAIAGAIKSCIIAHGPVTPEFIGSAAKRVFGQLRGIKREWWRDFRVFAVQAHPERKLILHNPRNPCYTSDGGEAMDKKAYWEQNNALGRKLGCGADVIHRNKWKLNNVATLVDRILADDSEAIKQGIALIRNTMSDPNQNPQTGGGQVGEVETATAAIMDESRPPEFENAPTVQAADPLMRRMEHLRMMFWAIKQIGDVETAKDIFGRAVKALE